MLGFKNFLLEEDGDSDIGIVQNEETLANLAQKCLSCP